MNIEEKIKQLRNILPKIKPQTEHYAHIKKELEKLYFQRLLGSTTHDKPPTTTQKESIEENGENYETNTPSQYAPRNRKHIIESSKRGARVN